MTSRHRREAPPHMIGELFTFALFGMFLLLSLLIVVIGADGYRGVVDSSDSVGEVRTTLGYVAGKVRSEASMDGVTLEERDGVPVLVLTEYYEGAPYETIIYHQDGALYEVYMSANDMAFTADSGERLTEVAEFQAEWADENLLALTATASDGRTQTLHLALRTGQEVNGL